MILASKYKQLTTSVSMAVAMTAGAAGAQAQAPYLHPDGSFLTISGTVVAPENESFELDYGAGTITVEMDDWDAYGEARPLMDGDTVTVYGRMDDDFFEVATIEAGAVYVDQLNSYIYASSADEESAYSPHLWVTPRITPVSEITVRGKVTAVDGEDKTFTVKIGDETLLVETASLGYNPVDDKGFQRIDRGDWVSVSGDLDYQLIDGQVMKAKTLTTLMDDSVS